MNQHTVVRAAGVVLALLAGAQATAAPAWAGDTGGGVPAPAVGDDLPLPLPLPPPLSPLRPLCAPASDETPSPFPALVNLGVQDVGVLSDIGPRTCARGPVDRAFSRIAGFPGLAGIVPAGS
ncbi:MULTISPECIES: hypothetical protein [Streptomyces]|uniref:hypothetical protein n=1 Tax=Streptomyces TaxID=1883 RepID=UPI00163B9215|nr:MULTISPECIES: hypothetical protein [Streptomyces]MBC2874609.1 hypothetical protein [Streptomyces sp. TYQ1024]UBI36626.1 hypothetical protein K7I03_09235 [Streptomyces mobaraensis]UKW29218.1 hypothetical protein MCU78_09215 [Streptomyces sp. TYQ1024]